MGKKLRIGIVGCGGIANGKHLPSLAEFPELCEIVAFCDIIRERAEDAAKKYGTPDALVCEDYHELIADPTIDVVHVCTPNREHSFITIDALEAGKHVMCEKPMAKTYAEAKAMYEASVRTGKKLAIGYQNRQNPENLYVKQLAEKGELGDIYYAKALAIRRRAVPTWGVFLNEEEQGGGPLIDIGTHALDLTLWIMNNYKPKMVVGNTFRRLADTPAGERGNGWGPWDPAKYTVEDAAFGYLVMENGAVITLDATWALNWADPREATYILCGTEKGVDTSDGLRLNYVHNDAQVIEKVNLHRSGAAFFEGKSDMSASDLDILKWLKAIIDDTPQEVLPEQAMVVTRILEGIYTSAKTGKPVYFDED